MGLGQCADLKGLGEKEEVVFFLGGGGLIPWCTLCSILEKDGWIVLELFLNSIVSIQRKVLYQGCQSYT